MKSRRFTAILIVLSLLLMLMPVQVFAQKDGEPADVAASSVSLEEQEEVSGEKEELVSAEAEQPASDEAEDPVAGEEQPAEDAAAQDEADAESAEITSEGKMMESAAFAPMQAFADAETDSPEAAEEMQIAEEDAETPSAGPAKIGEADDGAEASSDEGEEGSSAKKANELESEEGTEESTEADETIAQPSFEATSSAVTGKTAEKTEESDGQITVTYTGTIPEDADGDLNINVSDFGTADIGAEAGDVIKYVINLTDNTAAYAWKTSSGAVALADASGAVSSEIAKTAAAAVQLGQDTGSLNTADNWMVVPDGYESAGGNAFDQIISNQWNSGQSSQSIVYYQKVASASSIDSATAEILYPVVQFKLEKTESEDETAAVIEENEVTEEETAGSVLQGSVPLSVKKVLTGQTLKADQFSFELKDADGNVLQTKKNAEDGTVAFDSLSFTENDIGEHKYSINEVLPEGAQADASGKVVVDDIEYDTHSESVTITIALNDEGKLKATVRQSTSELTFTNKYVEGSSPSGAATTQRTSPNTGDTTPFLPYAGMLLLAGCGLLALQKRAKRA
ncbi:MAG: LPXTG cell wall anchor domain-containing protein [Eubacterium sp.]|nr:LPXTG cell wall anchor domain-containing protein [Eubacterium sp.]